MPRTQSTYRTDVPHYLDRISDPLGTTTRQTLGGRGNVVREVDPTGDLNAGSRFLDVIAVGGASGGESSEWQIRGGRSRGGGGP